jgi:hypothetical protein
MSLQNSYSQSTNPDILSSSVQPLPAPGPKPLVKTTQDPVIVRDPAQDAPKPVEAYEDPEFAFLSRYAALRSPSRSDPTPHSLRLCRVPAAWAGNWGRGYLVRCLHLALQQIQRPQSMVGQQHPRNMMSLREAQYSIAISSGVWARGKSMFHAEGQIRRPKNFTTRWNRLPL